MIAYFPKMETSYRTRTTRTSQRTRRSHSRICSIALARSSANPFMLLIVPSSPRTSQISTTAAYFDDMHNLTAQIEMLRPDISGPGTVSSPYVVSGLPVPRERYVACGIFADDPDMSRSDCRELKQIYDRRRSWHRIVRSDSIDVDPFSLDAETWIDDFRDDLSGRVDQSSLSPRQICI